MFYLFYKPNYEYKCFNLIHKYNKTLSKIKIKTSLEKLHFIFR